MRHLLPVLALLAVGVPVTAAAGAMPPVCSDADTAGLPRPHSYTWQAKPAKPSPGQVKSNPRNEKLLAALEALDKDSLEFPFARPVLKYPYGSLDIYGFQLSFVVSEEGRVTCAAVEPGYKSSGPAINYNREVFLQGASEWRFKPYLIDGKPSRIAVKVSVDEEELPRVHVPMPAGNPAEVTITQDQRPFWASFGPYRVELHGDGTAIYTSGDRDDPLGPQTYHVDAKAVQELVVRARDIDFWSLRDQYRSPNARDNGSPQVDRVNITLGGKTKSLNAGSGQSGMPDSVRAFGTDVLIAANIDFWQRPTLATLDQLKTNDFDFQSKAAGRLLLLITQNPGVKDDAVLALMQLGAPQDAKGDNRYTDEYQHLIDAALGNSRIGVATRLIEGGALSTDGKTDPDKVKWAFYNAVSSGKLAAVELMLPFHPPMTYEDYDDDHEVQVSVIRKLGNNCSRYDDPIPVAQRLIDLGADVNAHESDGRTLLHLCDDTNFAGFLLDHGANIEAVDEDGQTPLGSTYDEDLALLLLERGANPRTEKAGRNLRFNIKHNEWRKVKAWLESHGCADVLVAQPDDEKPNGQES